MNSIFALCVRGPHRQRTLDSIVSRYHNLRCPEPALNIDATPVKEQDPETRSALTGLRRGFQKTSISVDDSEELARLARAVSQEGITFELDPEAYIQLAGRCLGRHDGAVAGECVSGKLSG